LLAVIGEFFLNNDLQGVQTGLYAEARELAVLLNCTNFKTVDVHDCAINRGFENSCLGRTNLVSIKVFVFVVIFF
jgi:hypothetical protein